MSRSVLHGVAGEQSDALRMLALQHAFGADYSVLGLSQHDASVLYEAGYRLPVVVTTAGSAIDLGETWYQLYDPILPAERTTFGVLQARVPSEGYPTQSDVMGALEEVRERLGLTVTEAAPLIGVGDRSYAAYKSGEAPMPLARVQSAINATMALGCLSASRWEATRRVLTTMPEAAPLVATGQFVSLKALVDRAQAEIDRERKAILPAGTAVPSLPQGIQAAAAKAVIESPEFTALVPYLEAFAPGLRAEDAVSRTAVMLDLEGAVERLYEGDPLGADWLFLTALRAGEVDALMSRARDVLREPGPFSDRWAQFLSTAADEAWAGYALEIAGPVDDSRDEEPASARAAIDVADLGFDLVTGRVLRSR